MNTKSNAQPVDVLAVISMVELQANKRKWSHDAIKRISDANDAVLELIERGDYLCRTGEGMLAFREALNRCKGAAK